ncbi:hypothetical protein DSO57_1021328 [Entomophthora muscae]|uniref:Uncharacterized protein n=1 Tax=Entomophthora muscae TaxID=34485 RepID=A0ACC2U212_9FUNG|nr:hypothetical protein DSO57_1021328 [Entomophthora muscae]
MTYIPNKNLGTIQLGNQNKKLQQLPLIGETAAKQGDVKKEFKKQFFKIGLLKANCKPRSWPPGVRRPHTKPGGLPTCACSRQPGRSRHQPACQSLPAPTSQQGMAPPHRRAIHTGQIEKLPNWESKKGNFPKSKKGETAAQIWNLPNLEGVDKQPSITIDASTAEVEFGCIKVPEDAPNPCNAKDNILFPAKPLPFQSQMGIPDNTKCLRFPIQCFVLFMPH